MNQATYVEWTNVEQHKRKLTASQDAIPLLSDDKAHVIVTMTYCRKTFETKQLKMAMGFGVVYFHC